MSSWLLHSRFHCVSVLTQTDTSIALKLVLRILLMPCSANVYGGPHTALNDRKFS